MANNQIADLSIKLTMDGANVKSGMKDIEKAADGLGKKVGSVASGIGKAFAATAAAATAAVVAITKSAVQNFANYEQLIGGVETLFKDAAGEVEQYANQAFKTAGLSANQYMETVTSFSASLLQGLGGDTAKAAEIANKAVVDMSDNANKMGTSMEMIQNAYQGFAKQNYTMLDNLKLGYGGTASEMARLINDSGVLGDTMTVTANTVNSVSFDKMIEAIHVVQDNLGITGTTAKEASTTIQGSLNSLKASWQNMLTGLADPSQDFGVLIDNLVSSASTFAQNLVPVIAKALTGIGKLVTDLAPVIVEALPKLINDIAEPLIDAVITLIPAIVDALINAVPALIDGAITIVMKLTEALPSMLNTIVNGIMRIVQLLTQPANLQKILKAGITLLLTLVKAIPQVVTAIVDALPQIIDNLVSFLTNPETIGMLIGAAVELFMALVIAVPQILGSLLGAFNTLVGNLWEGIKSMFGAFAANFGNFITGIFKGAINGVLAFIEGFVNGPIDILNGFIEVINDAFGGIGVSLGRIGRINLPRLAQGGLATGATTAIIGEAGREAVLPLEQNTGNWSGLLASALAAEFDERGGSPGSGVIIQNMEFKINNELDAREIGRVMMESIRRAA